MFVAAVVVVGSPTAEATDVCDSDVVLVGIRGSGQKPDSGPSGFAGFGRQAGEIASSLKTRMESDGWTVSAIPIYYNAADAIWSHVPIGETYVSSVQTGVQNLTPWLSTLNSCTQVPSVVLMGYSQGADVIKTTLWELSDQGIIYDYLITSIVAVGDPHYDPGDSVAVLGPPDSDDGILGGWPLPPAYAQGSVTLCVALDAVCSPGWTGASSEVHSNAYEGSLSQQAAAYVDVAITAEKINRFNLSEFTGDIVKLDGDSVTSWLVMADGYRRWIPTGGDFLCFQAQGAQVHVLSSTVLDQIPDAWGSHAICDPFGSTSEPAGAPSTPPDNDRIGYVSVGGILFVKDGDLTGPWVKLASNVESFQLEDNRVAYVGEAGVLWIKEGELDATWVQQASNVAVFHLEGNRVGYLSESGVLWVRDDLGSPWVQLASNVADFQLEGDRVAYVSAASTNKLWVKEGTLSAGWKQLASNVVGFQMEGDRVATLRASGAFYVKEGPLTATWVFLGRHVQDFQLEGDRVAVHTTGNKLKVKDGSLSSSWNFVVAGPHVHAFELEGDRIGYLRTTGVLWVKQGALGATWQQMASNVVSFALHENRIGYLAEGEVLWAKEGGLGTTWIRVAGKYVDTYKLE